MYSESELIRKIRGRFGNRSALVGIGDDAAVLETPRGFSTVFCSDLMAEGTHFRRTTHPPDSIGFKAIAVNVSDIGAMGGRPICCVLSLAAPPDLDASWIDGLLEGVAIACEDFEVELVGGDTSRAASIFVDVAMIGQVPRGQQVRRGGAGVGDGIYVTGNLGHAALGLRMLEDGRPDHPSVQRQLYPKPRHALGQELAPHVTAMIDVSDGLSVDLGHVLEASGVSARIEEAEIPRDPEVPIHLALHGGEDYELLVTSAGIPSTLSGSVRRIGEIIPASETNEIFLVTESGEEILPKAAWQHFT